MLNQIMISTGESTTGKTVLAQFGFWLYPSSLEEFTIWFCELGYKNGGISRCQLYENQEGDGQISYLSTREREPADVPHFYSHSKHFRQLQHTESKKSIQKTITIMKVSPSNENNNSQGTGRGYKDPVQSAMLQSSPLPRTAASRNQATSKLEMRTLMQHHTRMKMKAFQNSLHIQEQRMIPIKINGSAPHARTSTKIPFT